VNADGVLVVGYGNPLRGDDAFGPRVAEMLVADGRLSGARIEAHQQLTPELADDVAAAQLVVLVDARYNEGAPGVVRVEQVAGGHRPLGSHAVDAGTLVELAARLYGHAPPVVLVSVSAGQFDLGADLSPAVASMLPHVVDTVVAVCRQRRASIVSSV
jgi:hydrogenase maturation protease